jgi:hypothetical protein
MALETLISILATLGFLVCGIVLLTLLVGLTKILRQGPSRIDQLDRAGFGPAALWRGKLPKQSAGSSVTTKEGVLLSGSKGRVRLKQTRAISRHFF